MEKEPILEEITDANSKIQGVHAVKGLTIWTTVVVLVGEMAGSGVLALPKALADAGWIGLPMIIMGCFVAGFNGIHLGLCWTMLLERFEEFAVVVRYPYPAIAEKAVGKWMRYGVAFCVDFTLFGVCTLFLILISQNLHSLFNQLSINLSFCLWMVIVAALLIPLSWFGSPKDFWLVAVFASLSAVVACILLFISFTIEHTKADTHEYNKDITFTNFFLSFGAIMFSYGGASTFPTIQHDMKEPSNFKYSVVITFTILLVMYLPPSIMGFVTYKSDINANALLSLPDGWLRMTIEILITLHLFFAFVIALNPLAQHLEEICNCPNRFTLRRVGMRTSIVLLIFFVGVSIPHFGAILSLVGGSTVTFLTFIAPSIFYLCLCSQTGPWPTRIVPLHEKVLHCEIIGVGVLAAVAATYSAILELASRETFIPPCYINSTAAGT